MPHNSLDEVSKIEMPEVHNAIQQALKEVHQRSPSPSLKFYSRIRYQPSGAGILRYGSRITYARQQLLRSLQNRNAGSAQRPPTGVERGPPALRPQGLAFQHRVQREGQQNPAAQQGRVQAQGGGGYPAIQTDQAPGPAEGLDVR